MSVLGLIAADVDVVSGGSTRPLLLILLMLAILFLLAGAIIAVVALRNQRKDVLDVVHLEQLENEAS